jgi:hypothetical protein
MNKGVHVHTLYNVFTNPKNIFTKIVVFIIFHIGKIGLGTVINDHTYNFKALEIPFITIP